MQRTVHPLYLCLSAGTIWLNGWLENNLDYKTFNQTCQESVVEFWQEVCVHGSLCITVCGEWKCLLVCMAGWLAGRDENAWTKKENLDLLGNCSAFHGYVVCMTKR